MLGSAEVVVSEEVEPAEVPEGSVLDALPDALLEELVVIVAELAPVSSPSSSAGQAVRLSPIRAAVAVRDTTPSSFRSLVPQWGHFDSRACTWRLQAGQATSDMSALYQSRTGLTGRLPTG